MRLTKDISVNTFTPILLSLKYWTIFWRLATSVVCTNFSPPDSSCSDGERWHGLHTGQRQTRRAVGNTGHPADEERLLHCHVSSGGPEVLIEDPLPKCGAQEGGLREQHMGVTLPRVGVYIQNGLIFTFFGGGWGGWGKVWDTSPGKCLVNKDIAPLTEPSYDCLSSSTLPAEHGPHCLPYCNTNSHTLFPISVPVGLKDEGTLNGLSRDTPFSPNSTEGTR